MIPADRWRNVLTGADVGGGEQRLAVVLSEAPVALLERM
jgi:hypothetical protein